MRTSRLSVLLAAAVLLATADASAANAQDVNSRKHNYVVSLVGPGALFSIGAAAAVDQLENDPESWEKTTEGFGKRLASSAGSRFANQTTRHGIAALLDRTTEYHRCGCTSFGSRFGHAVAGAIIDKNDSGQHGLSVAQLAGAAAGAAAPTLWRPDYDGAEALKAAGLSLGLSALGNVVKEFILH
jgi:hypothetical protein